MRLLLDTHAFLWWLTTERTLAEPARAAIADVNSFVAVSAASGWEISTKRALGKLEAPDELEDAIAANDFVPLAITFAHGLAAGALPRHHDDPFDRMLIAQARVEGLMLVTRDPVMARYEVAILPA